MADHQSEGSASILVMGASGYIGSHLAPRRITLVAEMKLPGSAILEIEVVSTSENASTLFVSARFHPSGAVGLAYWYSLLPVHNAIFNGMPRAIARRAERAHAARTDVAGRA